METMNHANECHLGVRHSILAKPGCKGVYMFRLPFQLKMTILMFEVLHKLLIFNSWKEI